MPVCDALEDLARRLVLRLRLQLLPHAPQQVAPDLPRVVDDRPQAVRIEDRQHQVDAPAALLQLGRCAPTQQQAKHVAVCLVGVEHVPESVQHHGGIGLLLGQDELHRLLHHLQRGRGQAVLGVGRRKATGKQQAVALAQRHAKAVRQRQHHFAAGPGAAGFKEADMPLRYPGGQRQRKLAVAALAAPVTQQAGEIEGGFGAGGQGVHDGITARPGPPRDYL